MNGVRVIVMTHTGCGKPEAVSNISIKSKGIGSMGNPEKVGWEELVMEKRKRQARSIPEDWIIDLPSNAQLNVTRMPEECGLLTAKELEITGLCDVDALLTKMNSGEWSSAEVTLAFCKRAVVAHQVTSCLTEIFVEKALARATELDNWLKVTGSVVGPLHGLPISLKDQLAIQGIEMTMGYASWVGQYSDQNAVLVDILHECGAVPFVRTNIPQTLMWGETHNHIFGRTVNPYNRTLTAGGSSGGEGALIAMKGSPLGVGSDIAGSIRIPAAFCGLYALRPSYHRLPYRGVVSSFQGQDGILGVVGPMTSSISGLKVFMKAVINTKPWLKDPLVVRKPWDDEAYALVDQANGKKLCFAVMWDDGVVVPHPPVRRALETTKKALEDAGHIVLDWKPLNHGIIWKNVLSIFQAASEEEYLATAAVSGEPLIRTMHPDDPTPANVIEAPGISARQLWALHDEKKRHRMAYLDHWQATQDATGTGRPVDAIIAPCAPYTAPPHGGNWYVSYTGVWNALDYPASVFPVTRADASLDKRIVRHEFLSEFDKDINSWYDPNTAQNMPVNLQLIGRTLEEEAVIRMTEIVDMILKQTVHEADK